MLEHGKVADPTLNIEDFTQGDPVFWLMYDQSPSIGFVTRRRAPDIDICHFEGGYPFCVSRSPQYGSVRKTTIEEALRHLQEISAAISEGLQDPPEEDRLRRALEARKQFYLDSLIAQIRDNMNPWQAINSDHPRPRTGVYVLMGIYSGQGPSEHLEAITTPHSLKEPQISRLMFAHYPRGFGRIPSDVYHTAATSHGSLVNYGTYEVPQSALKLVENPFKVTTKPFGLESQLSQP